MGEGNSRDNYVTWILYCGLWPLGLSTEKLNVVCGKALYIGGKTRNACRTFCVCILWH